MTARTFYAAIHPRGFSNETDVHQFSSMADRDEWVRENGPDVNTADRAAWTVTAAEARSLCRPQHWVRHST